MITNATFVGNNADTGDVIYNYEMGSGEGEVTLRNAIFRENNDDQTNASLFSQAYATTTVTDAIVDRINDVCTSAVTCTRVIVEDPDFASPGNPDGSDGRYATADDGLRLVGYSPAVDAGNSVINTSVNDVVGNDRVFGATVDLGAYEHATYESESDTPDVGTGTGFFKLGSIGATVLFTSNASSAGGLTGSVTASPPTGDGLPSNLTAKTGTISSSLDGTFTYNVTFDLAGIDGVDDFSLPRVYKSNDGGQTWAAVPSLIHDEERQTLTGVGLSSFSQFAVGDDANPLPVELAGFRAERSDTRVHLTWETASETNNAGFYVERLHGGAGGRESAWDQVGFVEGAGTSEGARTYQLTDISIPFTADSLTYRLRQVDLDGTTTFSDAISVRLEAPTSLTLHAPYPNPTRSSATLRYALPTTTDVEISVYNVLGQRVAMLANGSQVAGRVEQRLETDRWPSELYFVRLVAGGQVKTQRLMVVR